MNRHSMISQLQRLVKSLVSLFRASVKFTTLADFDMTQVTTLDSDVTEEELIEFIQAAPDGMEDLEERWFFVNGIGGEYYWLGLACQKLAQEYGRKVVGVFNRGDGLLWDLVECAGQRSAREHGSTNSQDLLCEATTSSVSAQGILYERLKRALGLGEPKSVVVVAHSQGCLVLRLALEQLIRDGDEKVKQKMRDNLCVFTFGNPSIHWMVHEYSRRTEHYANETDFVAKLGVLRLQSKNNTDGVQNGYSDRTVFVNKTWKGHMFGAQYSLDKDDYVNAEGERSWLLNCSSGGAIGSLIQEFF